MKFYVETKGGSFFVVDARRYCVNTEYTDSICFTDKDDHVVCEIRCWLVRSISVFIHTNTYNPCPKELYLYKVMDNESVYDLSHRWK